MVEVYKNSPQGEEQSNRDKCTADRKELARLDAEIKRGEDAGLDKEAMDRLTSSREEQLKITRERCKAVSNEVAEGLTTGVVMPTKVQLSGTEPTEDARLKTENVKEGLIQENIDEPKREVALAADQERKNEVQKETEKNKNVAEEEVVAKQSDGLLDSSIEKPQTADQEIAVVEELGGAAVDSDQETYAELESVSKSGGQKEA